MTDPNTQLEPLDLIAPGAVLRDWMKCYDIDRGKMATLCSMESDKLQRVFDGKPLGTIAACKLQQGTGIPAQTWLNLENAFRYKRQPRAVEQHTPACASGEIDATCPCEKDHTANRSRQASPIDAEVVDEVQGFRWLTVLGIRVFAGPGCKECRQRGYYLGGGGGPLSCPYCGPGKSS